MSPFRGLQSQRLLPRTGGATKIEVSEDGMQFRKVAERDESFEKEWKASLLN